ncbi:MAG: bacterial transcriptional activator domain-containing protein [Acidimicrobiales bacterium]|nr:bacterial transcriptional activator domain-containing protein [Acidimicrobiales bacterium]
MPSGRSSPSAGPLLSAADLPEPRERHPSPSHVVLPRETLWSIAASRLGSALLWKDIAELNYGMTQPDGDALTTDHWVRPGWSLRLPPVTGDPHPDTRNRPPDPCDRRRDTPARPPEGDLRGAMRHGHRGIDNRPDPGPPPLLSDGLPGYANGFIGARTQAAVIPSVPTNRGNPAGHPLPPFTPVGGGVVGAGVVNLLERMRRAQQRHRNDGTYIRLPDQMGRAFEQRLRIGDGPAVVHDVDHSLRLLVRTWMASGRGMPVVNGVRVHREVIELVLESAVDAGPACDPFALKEDGRSVLIDRGVVSDQRTSGAEVKGAPAPMLATVGLSEDGLVMVNLESMGSLVINGDPAGCEGVVRALALELATSLWAGQFDLFLVGFGAELERFERVTTVPDVPWLIRQLSHRRISGTALLEATGYRSFAHARCVEASDAWDPVVVICGPATPKSDTENLLGLASDPSQGTAIVTVGGQAASPFLISLTSTDNPSSLDLLGSVVFPQRLESEELDEVTLLLDTASNRESILSSDEPYVDLPIPLPAPVEEDVRSVGGPVPARPTTDSLNGCAATGPVTSELNGGVHQVEVAVLGPIEIRGAAREFTRAGARELVIYLALHPNGASNEAWATALWPDRLMAPSSLHSTASVARRALGQSPDGLDHLPRSHGRLALSSTVATDWDRFVVLADSRDNKDRRSALELVRGRPFEGLRSADWPILEGIGPAIEAAVVDLSGRLAGACLATGDPKGAEWASRKGLLVSPYDERLYRMLMRAADLGGHPAGVEAVMAELVKLVADDVEPFDSVHPRTMDLYRSLTRRRSLAAGKR